MIIIKSLPGQTLLDIAVRYYGDAQGLIWILEDNPNLEQADDLAAGIDIKIRDEKILKDVVAFFEVAAIQPATATQFTDKTGVYELETYESATYQKQ
jgi:hypothetical protein